MGLERSIDIFCPYCGEQTEILVDPSVPRQEYIEDCSVCCRPITISVSGADTVNVVVDVRREDE